MSNGCANTSNVGTGETTAVVAYTKPGGYVWTQNNTLFSNNEAYVTGCTADYNESYWDPACNTANVTHARFDNNLIVGTQNVRTAAQGACASDPCGYWALYRTGDGYNLHNNPGGSRKNNLWYGPYATAGSFSVNDVTMGATGELTSNPQITASSPLYSADARLTASSPAINGGIAITGLTTDFAGNARSGLPDIGAYEYGGAPPTCSITTTSLPGATVGQAYTATLAQTACSASTWAGWTTCQGISLNASTGVLSGTVTGSAGTCSGTLTYDTASQPLSITISATAPPASAGRLNGTVTGTIR